MAGLLDVILGYECNLACDYCTITPAMRRRELPTGAVLQALRNGRKLAYDRVSFTGGEPTIRRDLLGLIRAARALGFTDIKVQTNGLLLAQVANLTRLLAAGVSRIHLSIHTHEAANYERLVRRVDTHRVMVAGLKNVIASGLPLVVDLILKADTVERLPDTIAWLAELGVGHVDLWLVSLTDGNRDNIASLPQIREFRPTLNRAFAAGKRAGIRVRSLHIPRCLLGEARGHAYDPGSERVMVVTPEASFELRDSKLTGTVHVPACEGCEHRSYCPGIRPDYLEVYGDAEIASARGQAPTLQPTRHLPVMPSNA
ncbi:MAG TPA: radical SAM protein [Nannocystis exedens]|nr:radical SAM protein [Nannocystis exedens]